MISRSAIQTLWQQSTSNLSSPLKQTATHYSFSVSNENCVFVVQYRSEERADYLLIIDILTDKVRELKFAPIRSSHATNETRIWTFEECSSGFGIINFRTDNQAFGVAICCFNSKSQIIYSEEIQLLTPDPHIPEIIYTTRKAQNGKIYLLEDPLFPRQIYSLENGYVDGENSIPLHYDIRQRHSQIEDKPDQYLCINDGIDKTCCELSIFLAHRQSGLVQNYITKLTSEDFPLKCENRLVENMHCIPFKDGILSLFQYGPKESEQEQLSAFAYLDLNSLKWQNLNIKSNAQFVHFQVVGELENILMIMETENDTDSNPILKAIHRFKIGSMESLRQLCYYTLLKHMPEIRTMSEEERREKRIIYFP